MRLLPRLYYGVSLVVALCSAPALQRVNAQTPVLTPPQPVETINAPHTVQLKPYSDPWPSKAERWRDISNYAQRDFDAFIGRTGEIKQTFNYNNATVTLTYDQAPGASFFVGKINATGLKPNFCYQLKLVGKPTKGVRGWGALGDDAANEKLGLQARWWCDSSHSTQTNFTDAHYFDYHKNAATKNNTLHEIYGYLYMGMFVTDEYGSTNGDFYFTGEYNFHVTRQGWDTFGKHHFAGEGLVYGGLLPNSTTEYYGYGKTATPEVNSDGTQNWVKLWYEYEYIWARDSYGTASQPRPTNGKTELPTGKYNCRFLLTEESFHEGGTVGGVWATVLGSEDYTTTNGTLTPDQDRSNDIVFTIGLPGVPTNLTATPGNGQVGLSWTAASGATSYKVKRATTPGGPYETTVSTGVTATNLVDSTVTNGTTYYYVVSAANSVGENLNSNEASATPELAAPQAPANLTATAGTNQVTLAWAATFGAESYNVKRAEVTGGPYTAIASAITGTNFVDNATTNPTNPPVNGTTYYYMVSALNSAGESADSAEKSATPVAQPAATPAITPNGGTYFGSVSVSLSSPDGSALYYTTDGSDPTQSSTPYSVPFALTSSATVKARAFKEGSAASSIASAAFTINKTATLTATEDAHVQAGNFASKNFGTLTTMEVKTSTSAKENRDAYLKFDLQSLGVGTISSAKLRIYTALSASGSLSTSVYGVSNTTWTQSTLNWNNKPARGSVLGSASVTSTAYAWKEIDITSYIQSEWAAGRKTISLALHNGANSSPLIKVNSKEASTNKPQLLIGG
jgi:hypothetical protein